MSYLRVIECAYDLHDSESNWLERLAHAAAPCLPRGLSTIAYTAQIASNWRSHPDAVVVLGDPAHGALCQQVVPQLRAHDVRRAYARGYASLTETFAGPLPEASINGGVHDFVSMMSIDGDGSSVVLGATMSKPASATEPARRAWAKVAAHVVSGMRLRRALIGKADRLRGADGIFDASGRCVQANNRSSKDARDRLRAAVRDREWARSSKGARDPGQALDVWQGMIAGRWSLVDEFESDGRRFICAYRNDVPAAHLVALTPAERRVVQLIVLGRTNKEVAYALGLSQSTVSTHLKQAVEKLRVSSPTDLIRLFHHVRGASSRELDPPAPSGLTILTADEEDDAVEALTLAEREVLGWVGRGLTNEQIAAVRGTSPRTVANQISAVFRKTNASSRRELAGRPSKK